MKIAKLPSAVPMILAIVAVFVSAGLENFNSLVVSVAVSFFIILMYSIKFNSWEMCRVRRAELEIVRDERWKRLRYWIKQNDPKADEKDVVLAYRKLYRLGRTVNPGQTISRFRHE